MGPGEVVWWFRALAALAEDLGLISSTLLLLTTICNSSSGDLAPSPGFPEYCMHMEHIHTCGQITQSNKSKHFSNVKEYIKMS